MAESTHPSLPEHSTSPKGSTSRESTRPESPTDPDLAVTCPQLVPGEPAPPGSPRLPGYEILGELGRGGMGIVYKALQVRANRLVALKTLRAGAGAAGVELARFLVEVQAVAALSHPNVVPIYEVGEHEGLPFYSMEYCAGGSL